MLALTSEIKTPYHGIKAWVKLALLSGATVGLFAMTSLWWLMAAAIGAALLYSVGGAKFTRLGLTMLRPLRVLLGLLFLWHLVTGDAERGAEICLRLATAVALANLVTLTTRLDDMIEVVMRLLSPFERLGLSTHSVAFAIALVIRFVPVVLNRSQALQTAWRARSVRTPVFHVVVPLTIGTLDDADHVALALRARGGVDADYQP